MSRAINCTEKCASYEDCKEEDVLEMFVPNATCPDYYEEEQETENEN